MFDPNIPADGTPVLCTCEEFKRAQDANTDSESDSPLIYFRTEWYIASSGDSPGGIAFCPWCGKRVPDGPTENPK